MISKLLLKIHLVWNIHPVLMGAFIKLDAENTSDITSRLLGNTYNDIQRLTSNLSPSHTTWIYNGPYADIKQKRKRENDHNQQHEESTISESSMLLKFGVNGDPYKKEFAAVDKLIIEQAKPGDVLISFRPITYRTQPSAEPFRQYLKENLHILVLKLMPQSAMTGVQQATEIMVGIKKDDNDNKE